MGRGRVLNPHITLLLVTRYIIRKRPNFTTYKDEERGAKNYGYRYNNLFCQKYWTDNSPISILDLSSQISCRRFDRIFVSMAHCHISASSSSVGILISPRSQFGLSACINKIWKINQLCKIDLMYPLIQGKFMSDRNRIRILEPVNFRVEMSYDLLAFTCG